MKHFSRALFIASALMLSGAQAGAQPAPNADAPPKPDQGPIYSIGFYEVLPADAAKAATLLKTYRDATRKENGAIRVDAYQETGQTSRVISYEIWRDEKSYEAHSKAASVAQLNAGLLPIEEGPPDIHPHFAYFMAGNAQAPESPATTLIVSHLDVGPPNLPALLPMLNPLGKGSAKDAGMVRYQLLEQVNPHANHFRVVEEWTNADAFAAHNKAPHVRAFRASVAPLLGTPYDQRLYKLVN